MQSGVHVRIFQAFSDWEDTGASIGMASEVVVEKPVESEIVAAATATTNGNVPSAEGQGQ